MLGEEEYAESSQARLPCPTREEGASRAIPLCALYARGDKSVSRLYGHPSHVSTGPIRWDVIMLDLVFVILGAVLFLGALIYARACANV